MKIRNGFVSNSLSSSFVLDKEGMTTEQIEEFKLVLEDEEAYDNETRIMETKNHFIGNISMHSNYIGDFLRENSLEAEYGG